VDISWFFNGVLEQVEIDDQHGNRLFEAKRIEFGLYKFSRKDNTIILSRLELDNLFLLIKYYKGEDAMNLQFILDYFSSNDTTSKSSPLKLTINKLILNNSHFVYDSENIQRFESGFDYNHMNINDINLEIKDLKIHNDTYQAQIKSFRATDTCGFNVEKLAGEVSLSSSGLKIENFQIKTPKSSAFIDLGLAYNRWGNWLQFIDSVSFDSQIDSCDIDFYDIAFFAPELEGSNIKIAAAGSVKGPVSNIKLRDFSFATGAKTEFEGRANISGLPDIEKSFIDVKINKFITNLGDISALRLPGNLPIELPKEISQLKDIKIEGRFTGFYNDFVSNANFNTALGFVNTDILIKPLKNGNKIAYNGRIRLNDFNLGGIFGIDNFKNLSLEGTIDGEGINQDAQANVNIDISNIKIAKYEYRDSKIVGQLKNRIIEATINSKDSIFMLIATGVYDFSEKLPKYNFTAEMINARVGRLFLSESDTFGSISGKLQVDASGNDIDNLTGNIFIDSLYYRKLGKLYQADQVHIFSQGNLEQRLITLNSKYIDGKIEGKFKFDELGEIYPYILNNFIPSMLNSKQQSQISSYNIDKKPMRFDFNFNLKETDDLFDIFYSKLHIADNSILNGTFNAETNNLSLHFKSDLLDYQGIKSENINMLIFNHLDTFDINVTANKLIVSKKIIYDSLVFHPMVYRDSMQILLSLGKAQNITNNIFINAGLQFLGTEHIKASFKKVNIWFNDSNWVVNKPNFIEFRKNYLNVEGFDLSAKGNYLTINGLLTESPQDFMRIKFNNFDLGFFNYYLSEYFIKLGGNITGDIDLSNVWKQLNYLAEFDIHNFVFNETPLGESSLVSRWKPENKAVVIDLETDLSIAGISHKYLNASGYYYPYKKEDNIDLNVQLKQFPLSAIKPFISSFSSEIVGTGTGVATITGKLAEPIIQGKIKTDVKSIYIDYLKTSYSLNDNIEFTKNYFGYKNAKIYDKKYSNGLAHSGNLDFKLSHNNFYDLKLNLDIKAHNMELLNTTILDNEMFYGYAVGDGKISITGPINDLYFNIDAKPLKGSKIAIPMSESASVGSNEFISFIIKDSTNIKTEEEKEDFFMSMDLRFDMTPEATVQLVMDETVGDIITANGSGVIRINVDKQYNVDMFGRYVIEKGDYLFTMQNIINKHFILDPGGSITWEGDMMDARLDMTAIYQTEAKLYDLLQMFDTTDLYKRRSKVDCKIILTGSLATPEIKFDIALPDETADTREKVAMVLYTSGGTTNQDIMNKNFISLIMLGSFQAPGGFSTAANPNALASNATEMLASQVSNWLSKMSKEVDIGFSWDSGDEATSQEIAVALSYQAFNDRLMINGKFGTGGENKSSESSTRIVGDLDVELALTKDKTLRARVYNKTNYEDPVTRKAPYTQGAGIVYRREFDTFRELFNKSNRPE
jgi:hypothetical protein